MDAGDRFVNKTIIVTNEELININSYEDVLMRSSVVCPYQEGTALAGGLLQLHKETVSIAA
ncbi:hypothetical protein VB735_10910 [Halotia wernerae UHCC 0503]|nr:hypothetical protein [Halotia wernerae UHCC 0503]